MVCRDILCGGGSLRCACRVLGYFSYPCACDREGAARAGSLPCDFFAMLSHVAVVCYAVCYAVVGRKSLFSGDFPSDKGTLKSSRVHLGEENDAPGYTLAEPRWSGEKCGAAQSAACQTLMNIEGTLLSHGSIRVTLARRFPEKQIYPRFWPLRGALSCMRSQGNTQCLRSDLYSNLLLSRLNSGGDLIGGGFHLLEQNGSSLLP